MYIENSDIDFELYSAFYQTERRLAINLYKIFKNIFCCNCFEKKM